VPVLRNTRYIIQHYVVYSSSRGDYRIDRLIKRGIFTSPKGLSYTSPTYRPNVAVPNTLYSRRLP